MKKRQVILLCSEVAALISFLLREKIRDHFWLFALCYILLLLLPQLYLILFETHRVIHTYRDYKQHRLDEERARRRRRNRARPLFAAPYISSLRQLLNERGIHSTRAGPIFFGKAILLLS